MKYLLPAAIVLIALLVGCEKEEIVSTGPEPTPYVFRPTRSPTAAPKTIVQVFRDAEADKGKTLGPFGKAIMATPSPVPTPVTVIRPKPTPSPSPRGWVEVFAWRWERANVRPEKLHFVQAIAGQIARNRERYERVSHETGVPWQIIGSLHNMEASLSFRTNLANGDTLTSRTRHVPSGRPPKGNPPFTWEYAATDALLWDKMNRKDWSNIGHWLVNATAYNGWGSEDHGIASAYCWSWTNFYDPPAGKYVADGQWSSTAVSQQCGVVPILKELERL